LVSEAVKIVEEFAEELFRYTATSHFHGISRKRRHLCRTHFVTNIPPLVKDAME
jgi:hypothetical protein